MPRDSETPAAISAGGALFRQAKALGVDHVFVNSGTDFPPIIEGLIDARSRGIELPAAITVPHEHVAVGMAHGFYLVSGRPQAVMLHTNVGLSNGATGAINAACDQIPMFLMSGEPLFLKAAASAQGPFRLVGGKRCTISRPWYEKHASGTMSCGSLTIWLRRLTEGGPLPIRHPRVRSI